jgi:hypothetical protein
MEILLTAGFALVKAHNENASGWTSKETQAFTEPELIVALDLKENTL